MDEQGGARYTALERYRAAGFWLDLATQAVEVKAFDQVKRAIALARSAMDDGDRSMFALAAGQLGDGGAA